MSKRIHKLLTVDCKRERLTHFHIIQAISLFEVQINEVHTKGWIACNLVLNLRIIGILLKERRRKVTPIKVAIFIRQKLGVVIVVVSDANLIKRRRAIMIVIKAYKLHCSGIVIFRKLILTGTNEMCARSPILAGCFTCCLWENARV